MLLAIDPGISTGWSLFSFGKLIECGVGEMWPLSCWGQVRFEALIEYPQVYPKTGAKEANDLITLALRVGRYQERLAEKGILATLVRPTTWKGSIPKVPHHNRAKGQMAENELVIAAQAETGLSAKAVLDLWDAVCLGLWHSGRLPKSGQAQNVIP